MKHRRLEAGVNKAMSKAVKMKTLMNGNNSMMQRRWQWQDGDNVAGENFSEQDNAMK